MFTADDRLIYSYQDGTLDTDLHPVTVYADPTAIEKSMAAALGGDVDSVIDLCQEYERDQDGEMVLVAKLDGEGKPIHDDQGSLVMVPNRIQLPDVLEEHLTEL